MNKLTLWVASTLIIALPSICSAQALATYNATGTAQGATSLSATAVVSNLTAGSMTAGNADYANNFWTNSFGLYNPSSVTSLTGAISASTYFTFTVTPASGYKVNISGVDLSGNFGSQNADATYYLEASVGNGFGSGSGNILTQWAVGGSPAPGPGVVNLSGNSAFQGVSGAVTFRIYVVEPSAYYQDVIGGGTAVGTNNSVKINGTVTSQGTGGGTGIATYNATGTAQGATSLSATAVTSNLTAGAMTVGNGDYANNFWTNSFGLWSPSSVTSLAGAISAGTYFTFTVTPTSGNTVSISGVDLSGNFGSQNADATYYLEASVGNGFGSGSGNILTQWAVGGSPAPGPGVVNLSGNSAFQGVSGAVTFRIYVVEPSTYYQDVIGGGTAAGTNNSVVVDGSVSGSTGTQPGISSIGINVSGDWLFADAIRQAQPHWDSPSKQGDNGATENSAGWPTQDASLIVWAGLANPNQNGSGLMYTGQPYNDGTYLLTFNGKANIALSTPADGKITTTAGANGTVTTTGTYTSSNNTTTAYVNITDTGVETLSLIFTNTQASGSGTTNTGITSVHLWRPTSEGAVTTYAPGTTFTTTAVAVAKDFSVTRFMDDLDTNENTTTGWSSRVLPGAWNQNDNDGDNELNSSGVETYQGIAYEYAVAYCNATNTDLYLNIPVNATLDSNYTTNLANLIKYGSTGTTPYTSTSQWPNGVPAYAPLNSNLHVYLEYSNELWNNGFNQIWANGNDITNDQNSNNAEWQALNYDGLASTVSSPNGYLDVSLWRRVAYQMMTVSNGFRAVFGAAAMPPNANATVRPLLEFGAGNTDNMGTEELQFLDNFCNNSDGVQHVTTPEPVNYFIWGAGGATYYNSNNDTASTVNALYASGIPNSSYAAITQSDTAIAKAYGLKRVAYEGGWGVNDPQGQYVIWNVPGSSAQLARSDSRAATAEESALTTFQQSGGDLNIFYKSSDWNVYDQYAMASQVFSLTSYLYQAMAYIDNNPAATVNYGTPIAGSATGATTTLAQGSQIFSGGFNSGSGIPLYGWTSLVTTARSYTISLNFNSTSTSGQKGVVLIDGQRVGSAVTVPTSGGNVTVGTVALSAGQHGLIVQGQYQSSNGGYVNGTFTSTFSSVVFTAQ